jgi:hypothetical protein
MRIHIQRIQLNIVHSKGEILTTIPRQLYLIKHALFQSVFSSYMTPEEA